jgi:hypothetical protein
MPWHNRYGPCLIDQLFNPISRRHKANLVASFQSHLFFGLQSHSWAQNWSQGRRWNKCTKKWSLLKVKWVENQMQADQISFRCSRRSIHPGAVWGPILQADYSGIHNRTARSTCNAWTLLAVTVSFSKSTASADPQSSTSSLRHPEIAATLREPDLVFRSWL